MNIYDQLQRGITENGGVECEQAPDAFFFEEEYKDDNMRYKIQVAKKICGDCPVQMLCLQYALESREDYGIWGGMTRAERKDLIRGRRHNEILSPSYSRREEGQRFRFAS